MGTRPIKTASGGGTSLVDALFSGTQQRVLGLIFGQPGRSFFATEIIEHVGSGRGAVQRELKKLAESRLVSVSRLGNQVHYRANPLSPIYSELCAIVRKTVGLSDPIRQALDPVSSKVKLALIYGSVAKGSDTAASDIDLLVVSDALTLEELFGLLDGAERTLARKVSPTLYSTAEFEQRRRDNHPFLQRVLAGETTVLIGTLDDE